MKSRGYDEHTTSLEGLVAIGQCSSWMEVALLAVWG